MVYPPLNMVVMKRLCLIRERHRFEGRAFADWSMAVAGGNEMFNCFQYQCQTLDLLSYTPDLLFGSPVRVRV